MRFSQTYPLIACLILVGFTAGCPRSGKVSTGKSPGDSGEALPEDLLKSAIHQLRPENYTIAAETDKPVNLLNSWRSKVQTSTQTPADLSQIPPGWITETQATRIQEATYDIGDAFHIRDAMLTHAIATFLASRAPDDVGQVQAIFDYVVRNIALRDESDLPLDPYSLLLLGTGSPEDRAWICASLLSQLRMDSVIVRPQGDPDTETWLLGVLLNGKIYLFDPRMGIAVPSTDDLAATSRAPATLEAIVAHPEWLKSLSVRPDEPYPIDAKMLEQPEIAPIINSVSWSQRMKQLEAVLPAEDVCVLYDPVSDEGGQAGLLSRLKKGIPGWKPEQKPWGYPSQRPELMKKMSPSAQNEIQLNQQILKLPIPVNVDPVEKKVTIGNPEFKMLRIRTDQMLGRFDDANKRYLSIRHLELDPLPAPVPQIEAMNRIAADFATYWTAVCKFEAGEYASAVEQLNNYLKRYERGGRWGFAARALLAESYARLGDYKQAVATLDRLRSDDPYRASNAIRVKRWNAQAAK
jgi:hypothetical protein